MYSSAYVWAKILNHMENRLTPAVVSTWFDDAEVVELNDEQLILYTASPFRKEIIQRRCTEYIKDAMKEIFNTEITLVVFGPEELAEYKARGKANTVMDFNPQFTFENFVVGSSNRFARSAAIAVANNPGQVYNPLFIYGPAGIGKTHLLYAIANELRRQHPDFKIVYIKGDQFTNELIAALQSGKNVEFRSKYREADLFLIDDIQFLAGKESTQEEFFHTFNDLHGAKKQIIISSDKPPKEIATLEGRLKSRFEWGLIADISSPDYETRMAILRKKEERDSKEKGYHLDDEVIQYIATNIKSNIRELEGALNRITAMSSLEHREITVELAQEALKDMISPNAKREITPDLILLTVAEHFHIKTDDIKGSKRSADIVIPRQIAMYLCREMTSTPLKAIGKLMGNRDHTTVLHGVEKISKEIETSDDLKNTIDIIKKKLNPN